MSREYFERAGKLYPCPNPIHEFGFGRVIGSWQLGKAGWSIMNDKGGLVTFVLSLHKVELPNGQFLHTLVIGKFSLTIGVVE